MRQDILGVGVDAVTLDGAVAWALEAMEERRSAYICTPNPEMIWQARRDPALREALDGAALSLPDGVGVVWAGKVLGRPLPERVAGYDFLLALLERMSGSVFFLGGEPGVAEEAAAAVEKRFPAVTVAGWENGFFQREEPVVERIRQAAPSLLLVCLGTPRQELFMAAHQEDLPVGLMAGLGGSIDVLAGRTARAPQAWRDRKLEWLYRLVRQPRRIKRQIRLPLFAAAVLAERFRPWEKES